MKRFLTYIILISMTLHCASRLGILSYLYKQRHDIAFSLGITAEKVIAMCNSDYHQQLVLSTDQNADDTFPLSQAIEINLFFENLSSIPDAYRDSVIVSSHSPYRSGDYSSFLKDIFHPPLV